MSWIETTGRTGWCPRCGYDDRSMVLINGTEPMCVVCAHLLGHYRRFIRGKDMRHR